ncbi:hypothetical protein [Fluviicola sp.]|uniref:hypothetical protein n=1 Tax=Fluviicola sp. TaxID=1917219 RepID=UPI00261177B7|nr:hypothetical protein [Fluviicola sp.]
MKEKLFPAKINSRKVVFIPVFFLFSCTNPLANKSENNVRQIASFQKEKTSGTTDSFPINYIIQNSRSRKLYYDLSKLYRMKLKRIQPSFFKKWFDQTPVNISENEQIVFRFSPDEAYYFFDYQDSDSVFFCSILEYLDHHQTFRMYHFTIDKQRQVIVHSDWVAIQSRKNGYCVHDRMNYNPKGNKLTVNSKIISVFHNFCGRIQSVKETFCFSINGTTRKTLKR